MILVRKATMRSCLATGLLAMTFIVAASVGRAQVTSAELTAAENGELPLVSPSETPRFGNFLSWQHDWQAPLPFDFYPDLPLYNLGGGRYLVDDRSLSYDAPVSSGTSSLEADESFGTSEVSPEAYGCGLWLSISGTASNAVVLTLHNTRTGQTYTVWSITNLFLTNWITETNLTGASGDTTDTLIAMGTRSNLFFRASEFRDYVLNTNATFSGLSYSDTGDPGIEPPDTMGAVGPNHFVELLNGNGDNGSIAVYDKSGHMVAQTNTLSFFAVTNNGTNYPTYARIDDVRILYDWQAQRWVASGEDFGSGQVLLAVSSTDSPTNLATAWSRYLVNVGRSDLESDFPTLGVDANGLYVTVVLYGSESNALINAGHTVVAIKKPEIYEGTFIANRFDLTNGLPVWMIQRILTMCQPMATRGL